MGFSVRALSPKPRCALTAPFHPYQPKLAVCFLWHFPASHLDWPLASILPCKARTFLPLTLRQAGDLLTNSDENLAKLAHKPPLVDLMLLRRADVIVGTAEMSVFRPLSWERITALESGEFSAGWDGSKGMAVFSSRFAVLGSLFPSGASRAAK